jgi:hypothetical protein
MNYSNLTCLMLLATASCSGSQGHGPTIAARGCEALDGGVDDMSCEGETREVSGPDQALSGGISVEEAIKVENEKAVKVVAWLWEPGHACPPCPPLAECSPCMSPYAYFGNQATYKGDGTDIGFDVVTDTQFNPEDVGQPFVLEGFWEGDKETNRRFLADRITRLSE